MAFLNKLFGKNKDDVKEVTEEKEPVVTEDEAEDIVPEESVDQTIPETAETVEKTPAEVDEEAEKVSFWKKLKSGLSKTKNAIFGQVDDLLKSFVRVDEDLLEELEELLCRNPFVSRAVVVGYVNEAREDYDIVAVLRPEVSEFEEAYGKNYSRGQVDAEFNRAVEEVNRVVAPFKKIRFFVVRREEFGMNSARKVRRSGVAEAAKTEYLRKLART